jgi:membrane fusion protein, multidrug efflux system
MMRAGPALALLPLLICAAGEPPRPVRVATVTVQPVPSQLVFSGTIQARVQADLGFRVPGKVTTRLVEPGDRVQAGQVLARLDQGDMALQEQAAEAALQAASADLANARADLGRYGQLGRASPAYVPSEFDKRTAASQMADARVLQTARQLALARSQRAYGDLKAEADGIVTDVPVQAGQVVAAGQTVATVAQLNGIEVVADVPENRLGAVRAAGGAAITLWAAPGQVLHGRVREIGALADPASRTYRVKVAIPDAPTGLLTLGMTATVAFGGASLPVARLPATALTDQGGAPAMWVLDAARQRAALRQVDIAGYGADGSVLVSAGLREGEQVVTAGVGQLNPEMAVTAWAGAAR